MISRKICLLGGVCVGKTSLANRYIHSSFSGDYCSTIGVKVHKKSLQLDEIALDLVVWDIQGEDRYDKVLVSFLKGLAGYILVVDSTHLHTVEVAETLRNRVQENFGPVPYVLVYSKCDLPEDPHIQRDSVDLVAGASFVVHTSSLNGDGVDLAFMELAKSIVPLDWQVA